MKEEKLDQRLFTVARNYYVVLSVYGHHTAIAAEIEVNIVELLLIIKYINIKYCSKYFFLFLLISVFKKILDMCVCVISQIKAKFIHK